METEGWLARSQEPATNPYRELVELSSHPPILFLEDPFQYYPDIERLGILDITPTSCFGGTKFKSLFGDEIFRCSPHSSQENTEIAL
jgi:hypothetical protein